MPDIPQRPSAFDDARRVRSERLAVIRAALQVQREHYTLYGEFPTASQVAIQIGLIGPGEDRDA